MYGKFEIRRTKHAQSLALAKVLVLKFEIGLDLCE